MTGTTVATHRDTATAAFGSGRVSGALAAGALVVMALLVALFLAMQSGHGARATTVPAQELVQQDRPSDQLTEPIYRPGRPY